MIGFEDLVAADPARFTTLADNWDQLAGAVAAHHERWRAQVHGGLWNGSWTGTAADAARGHVDKLDQGFAGHETDLRRVSTALRRSATDFADAQTCVTQLCQRAANLGLVIGQDGSVGVDPARAVTNLASAPAEVERLAGQLADALRSANTADQRAADALDSLAPRNMSALRTGATTPSAAGAREQPALPAARDLAHIPHQGTDPKEVKKWWDGLTPEERAQLPAEIGTLDGIPSAARDRANRRRLADAEKQLTAQYNDPNYRGDKDALRKKLIAIHDIQTRLGGHQVTGDVDPNDPTRHKPGKAVDGQQFLLGFSADGQGRAIIATGDPDTADSVVTTVPGVARGLNDVLYQDLANNDATTQGIRDAGGKPGKTAEIMWVGYDAPAGAVPPPSMAQAEEAAPALESFQKGLVATHQGHPAHMTVVGHSYGSDVVTEATMNGHKLVADDVIFIGSPGVPAEHAYEITRNMIPSDPGDRQPPTQVWASRTGHDEVPTSIGTAPTSSRFGASPFASDREGNHGGYWRGIGQINMANIALGNYQKVVYWKDNAN